MTFTRNPQSSSPVMEMQLMLQLQQAMPDASRQELAELLQLQLEEFKKEEPEKIDQGHTSVPELPEGSYERRVEGSAYPPATLEQPFLNLSGISAHENKEETEPPGWYARVEPFEEEIDSEMAEGIRKPAPLMPWQQLWPVVHLLFRDEKKTARLDIDTIIDKAIKQQPLKAIPWRFKPCWPAELILVVDFSRHLIPFFMDFSEVGQRLAHWLKRRLQLVVCLDAERQRYHYQGRETVGFPCCRNNAEILYIGDLGLLDKSPVATAQWVYLGQRLHRCNARIETLLVAHPSDWNEALQQHFHLHHWNGERLLSAPQCQGVSQKAGASSRAETEQLLAFLSWAIELSPALVRAARRLLGYHVSVEGLLFQHPALDGNVTFQWRSREERVIWRKKFKDYGFKRESAWGLIKQFEADLPIELQIEQRQHLGKPFADQQLLFLRRVVRSERDKQLSDGQSAMLLGWIERMAQRAGKETWRQEMHDLYALYWQKMKGKGEPVIPLGIDLTRMARWIVSEEPQQWVGIRQEREHLLVTASGGGEGAGAEIARFQLTGQSSITLHGAASERRSSLDHSSRVALSRDTERITIKTLNQILTLDFMPCPPWASAIGRDRYGLFVEVEVLDLSFSMRWIPPGQFKMGSPEDEPERHINEGPRQQITFQQGFWLAETACTQALWQTVMKKNPSSFTDDPQNPVENVSWKDAKRFIEALKDLEAGFDFRLPSEGEWEYACRAGSETPFWFGSELSTDEANYYGNYPYNKGKECEYRAKTLPVTSFRRNPWGLYQMHGNVMEWCEDFWHDSHEGADPQGGPRSQGGGVGRVLRGGRWSSNGRNLRSAYRYRSKPADGFLNTGFRLSRGPESPSQQGAVAALRRWSEGRAEQPQGSDSEGGQGED